MRKIIIFLMMTFALTASCSTEETREIVTGAERVSEYMPLLAGKRVGIVANQTTIVGEVHLIDSLVRLGVNLQVIFAPEHGFRDMADAGAGITEGIDPATGIEVVSLYSNRFKPLPEHLEGIDVVIFDIQDVGARFYTYISTMHYVMEACAENGVGFIVFDRPNPNGFYVDGPMREPEFETFVGKHPVPVVHGMTVGEYASMVNGEGWLTGGIKCDLQVIECLNYTHATHYELPVKPSPNLPNHTAVLLYPSICFFEGTNISLGRGTAFPFQAYGSPELPDRGFSFVPVPTDGASNPMHLGVTCYGRDLRNAIQEGLVPSGKLDLSWVIEAYNDFPDKSRFFRNYFNTLAGTNELREQIIAGMSAEEIRETWQPDIEVFRVLRAKYLIYP